MRNREYGGVPWYMMFTIVASIGSGVGAYHVLHKRELEKAEYARLHPAPPPPPPAPKPEPKPEGDPLDYEPTPVAEPATGVEPEIPSGLTIGSPSISDGDIDLTAVEVRVGGQREAIQKCFADTHAKGGFIVKIAIGSSGRASQVSVDDETFDQAATTCVMNTLRKVRYPLPMDNSSAVVTIPVVWVNE